MPATKHGHKSDLQVIQSCEKLKARAMSVATRQDSAPPTHGLNALPFGHGTRHTWNPRGNRIMRRRQVPRNPNTNQILGLHLSDLGALPIIECPHVCIGTRLSVKTSEMEAVEAENPKEQVMTRVSLSLLSAMSAYIELPCSMISKSPIPAAIEILAVDIVDTGEPTNDELGYPSRQTSKLFRITERSVSLYCSRATRRQTQRTEAAVIVGD